MGIVLRLLGSSVGPWILLGLVGALVATHGWAHHAGTVGERNAAAARTVRAIERRDAEHLKDLAARANKERRDAVEAKAIRDSLETRLAELATLPPKVLIKTVQVPDENGCVADVASLGSDFWVRYRAAGDRAAEADPAGASSLRHQM